MSIDKFFPLLSLFILCNSSLNAQDQEVIYNDTLTKINDMCCPIADKITVNLQLDIGHNNNWS